MIDKKSSHHPAVQPMGIACTVIMINIKCDVLTVWVRIDAHALFQLGGFFAGGSSSISTDASSNNNFLH
jgi:hypothetical protein